jgi:hypothetical protein
MYLRIGQGQLIAAFGPGAMADLPQRSVVVAGLDAWVGDRRQIREPRLARRVAELLKSPGIRLECPPEAQSDTPGFVQTYVFPLWFVTRDVVSGRPSKWRTRRLVQWADLEDQGRTFPMEGAGRSAVVPVRFVRACRRGHLGDIDWPAFAHGIRPACGGKLYFDERGASGDPGEAVIRCECGQERPLAQADDLEGAALGDCDGGRPWLGQDRVPTEKCTERNRLLVRAAANAWLAQTERVISLPGRDEGIRQAVEKVWIFLESAESAEDVGLERAKPRVREVLEGLTDKDVWESVKERRGDLTTARKPVKLEELQALISQSNPIGEDTLKGTLFARVLPRREWERPWMAGIERVLLVERLREVAALVGFTRFEAASPDSETGELNAGARRAEISRQPEWVPTVENRGEGIFVQFNQVALEQWRARAAVQERYGQLRRGFEAWKKDRAGNERKLPSAEFMMLHSFSHLLIAAVALDCGYSVNSMMERIYAIPQVGYGVLLYTASSDAEGSLGGLVHAGRRIARFVRIAQSLGTTCPNDPLCALHRPEESRDGRMLQGAACNTCAQIAESNCEQGNDFLDRSFVVTTVAGSGAEFFQGSE